MNNNNIKILAIDPSLSCTGFSIIQASDEKVIKWGKVTTTTKNTLMQRSEIIAKFLHDMAQDEGVDAVIYEDGFSGKNKKTGIDLSFLRGFMTATFRIYSPYIPIMSMEPSEVRKNLGLKGNANKEDVYKHILEKCKNDNLIEKIGEFSDKNNSKKTSDIYDSIGIGMAYCRYVKSKC